MPNGEAAQCSDRPPSTPSMSTLRRPGVSIYAWGRSDLGQLGFAVVSYLPRPQKIDGMHGKDVVHIGGNEFNSSFVTEDGELFTAGNNDYGQLGCFGRKAALSPAPSRVEALDLHKIRQCANGQGHMLAVTDQGLIASWGAGEFGQLGHAVEELDHPQPRILKGTREFGRFVRVAAGACHSLALTASGHVFSWGQGTFGALGHGDENNKDVPTVVNKLWPVGIVQVSCGENHSAALSIDGRVFTWGRGKYGQLGLGNLETFTSPCEVKALAGAHVSQIVCGGDHTLALTVDGAVYAWGKGSWGQTGLGFLDNTCRPNRVQGLMEHKVVQVAASMRNSMALTSTNQVFVWGNGEQGQLGSGVLTDQLSPRRLDNLPDLPILFLAAYGSHMMVVVRDAREGERVTVGPDPYRRDHGAGMMPIHLPHILDLCEAASAVGKMSAPPEAIGELKAAVEDVFCSAGFLCAGFSLPASSPVPVGEHNIDATAVESMFQAILKVYNTDLVAALAYSCCKLLSGIQTSILKCKKSKAGAESSVKFDGAMGANAVTLSEREFLPAIFIMFQNPLNGDASGFGAQLLSRLVDVVLLLPLDLRQLLAKWMILLPVEIAGGRVIRPLQRYLDRLAKSSFSVNRPEILRTAQLLDLLYEVNEAAPVDPTKAEEAGLMGHVAGRRRINLSEFYNHAVSSEANLRDEYVAYAENRSSGGGAAGVASLCQVPFILTPEAKSRLLQGEASVQKQHIVQNSALSAIFQGIHPVTVTFMDISVRRTHILHDCLEQIINRPQDLKKPLRVTFITNGVAEEGLDEGGVSREFFQLLVAEIFHEDYGMFTHDSETRNFWFNSTSLESGIEFQLVGIILGLAIYNGIILDVHFPLVVYKKLLGLQPNFDDLIEAQPSLARGLQQMLAFDGDVEDTFCRTFSVEYDYFGEMRSQDLMPGGSKVPVTAANRQKYVDLYCEWLLVTSVEKQFSAFAHGFHQVCGGLALSLFRYDELELLVCGLPHLDFREMEKNTRYEGGYHAGHPAIKRFWSILHAMSLEQKRKLLSFATGCNRAPVGGLGRLILTIQRSGPDSDRLPTAHTCFNTLLLPEYSSVERMKERLLVAVENAQGFGLK